MTGRCAVITGATGHLGSVISSTLAELGADLVLVDKADTKLKNLSEEISMKWGVAADFKCCDLESKKERVQLLKSLEKENINCLVNNAAFVGSSEISGWNTSFEHQTLSSWQRAMEVNLTAPFHLCQGLKNHLKNAKGSIINITSIYAHHGPDWQIYEETDLGNPAAYSVSKGGLTQLTRWLSTTLAPEVRVNAIAPGGIFRNQPNEFVKKYVNKVPLRRMAHENDLIGAVAYLASDLSKYVTGQTIRVDGGWGV